MSDDAARVTAKDILIPGAVPPRPARLPLWIPPVLPMELFEPEAHLPPALRGNNTGALPLFLAAKANPKRLLIPREEDCLTLWDVYAVPEHIRIHSRQVANLARGIALAARENGAAVSVEAVFAAGLLHDLGKMYAIDHGGSHAQLGASWVMRETRNGPIAQAVLFHVHWPWDLLVDDDRLFITMAIIYSDKRVRHTEYVSLDDRFIDLVARYGVSDYARMRIAESKEQGEHIEVALSRRLGVNLNEYTADSRGLVKRT